MAAYGRNNYDTYREIKTLDLHTEECDDRCDIHLIAALRAEVERLNFLHANIRAFLLTNGKDIDNDGLRWLGDVARIGANLLRLVEKIHAVPVQITKFKDCYLVGDPEGNEEHEADTLAAAAAECQDACLNCGDHDPHRLVKFAAQAAERSRSSQ